MAKNIIDELLTPYQKYYWKNPEHCRALQRDKYQRYPERIKEMNAKWQKENAEYISGLRKINSQIWYYTHKRFDAAKARQLIKAREEYKLRRKTNA